MRRISLAGLVLIFCMTALTGCPLPESIQPMDVDVAQTDAEGNPTEILVTELGGDLACTAGQESIIYRSDLSGNVVWEFGQGQHALFGAHNADLNDAGDEMIISDSCNDRVIVIRYPDKTILWDSSVECPELELSFPNDANFLGAGIDEGNLLITVMYKEWVIEVDPSLCNGIRDGEIVWSFGEEGIPRNAFDTNDPTHLYGPHNADRLPNGNIIIADSGTALLGPSRIIEIDPDYPGHPNKIVWNYQKLNDCTIKGIPDQLCVGLNWGRDADVECDDPACETGLVVVTGMHRTLGVLRDLNEEPPPGESIPRGRNLIYHIPHEEVICYDSDMIPKWGGDDNEGLGFFLVSSHFPEETGKWLRVVPVDAGSSLLDSVWELRSFSFLQ